jgi:ABC-type Fe3+/spermidine/putrescine transport system ATPase subunit
VALEIRGLRKSYGDFSVDLSLRVESGETLVLAGPSGCGKTTALSLIAGIIQAEGGDILADGRSIQDLPPWKRHIAVVFQDLALFPHLDVGKNVAYGLFMHGVSKPKRRRIVAEALELVRLSGYEGRRIDTLSGGEQQRVAIARALAMEPRAMLLDEPFSSLDAPLRRSLRAEFRGLGEAAIPRDTASLGEAGDLPELASIPAKAGIPCLFVTHDREEAAALGDRIALMSAGRIVETGAPKELFLSPKTELGARFFGAGLVLDCSVLGPEKGGTLVDSPLGKLLVPAGTVCKPGRPLVFVPRDALGIAENGEGKRRALCRNSVFVGDRLILELEIGGISCIVETGVRTEPPPMDSPVALTVDEALLRFV